MTLYGTLALICWIGFFASMIWTWTMQFKVVEAINRKRTGEELLDLFNHARKWQSYFDVWALYRRFYPEGNLVRIQLMANISAIVWFVLVLLCLVQAVSHSTADR